MGVLSARPPSLYPEDRTMDEPVEYRITWKEDATPTFKTFLNDDTAREWAKRHAADIQVIHRRSRRSLTKINRIWGY